MKDRNLRIVSLVLVLGMLLGCLGAFAESGIPMGESLSDQVFLIEDPDIVEKAAGAESLFIASDRHDNNFQPNTGKLPRVLTQANNWLKSNRNGGIEAVCLAGDNVAGGGSAEATHSFSTSQLDEEIFSALPDLKASDTFYTYGSHDGAATDINTAFLNRGSCAASVERGSYYIYGVDYMDVIDYKTGKPSADKFLSWAKNAKPSKPVIMVSHVPLHANRGDQTCAQTWVNTINTAVDQYGLDIIFVFGHNHTTEGGNEIYKEKGTTLSIQKDNANGASEFSSGRVDGVNMTLKFTYLNGGYLLGGKQTTANNAEGTTYTVDTAGKKLYIDRFNLSGHMNTKTVTLTGGSSAPVETSVKVTFYADGKHYTEYTLSSGSRLPSRPASPSDITETGLNAPLTWTFENWYTDAACTKELDWSQPITSDTDVYAQYSYETFMGDLDRSGRVNGNDATIILQSKVRLYTLDAYQEQVADLSGNGTVSSEDATFVLQIAARILDQRPVILYRK